MCPKCKSRNWNKERIKTTKNSILEEIAEEVDRLLYYAVSADENCFNPDEYIVSSDHILRLNELLQKLVEMEEGES